MDTCNKVSKYMMKSGYDCRVMGIQTIDNDLFGTDHCGLCFRGQVYRDLLHGDLPGRARI